MYKPVWGKGRVGGGGTPLRCVAAVHFANGGRGVLVANVISINRLSGLWHCIALACGIIFIDAMLNFMQLSFQ